MIAYGLSATGVGIVLGCKLRFPTFAIAMLAAAAIVVVSDLVWHTGGSIVRDMIVTIVGMQVGYGLGIGLRSAWGTFIRPRVTAIKHRRHYPAPRRQ
ncbi:MAG TPA: hypothetical protein VFA12_02890 [Stellaceae bacterium]|nr:hypothetical protein [Stellaceae bacterium]